MGGTFEGNADIRVLQLNKDKVSIEHEVQEGELEFIGKDKSAKDAVNSFSL